MASRLRPYEDHKRGGGSTPLLLRLETVCNLNSNMNYYLPSGKGTGQLGGCNFGQTLSNTYGLMGIDPGP
eukprot:3326145-Pyramimonas_sp.AAC.2